MRRRLEHRPTTLKSVLPLILSNLPSWLAFLAMLLMVYDIGFEQAEWEIPWLKALYKLTLIAGIINTGIRYLLHKERPGWGVLLWDGLSMAFLLLLLAVNFSPDTGLIPFRFLQHPSWVNTGLFLVFIREFSVLHIQLKRSFFNPAQLFVFSFLFIIFSGSLLLMLPKATYDGISFFDALFTSTSAVCVNGLMVVDTATHFTRLGQTIILILFQIGGLGIMTFASYFSYFFRGGNSYNSQLMMGPLTNAQKMSEVFSVLKVIMLITFLIEGAGCFLIYMTLDVSLIPLAGERFYFALFHSVSGFCNAGFSTLSGNLYETGFSLNYPLHLIIAGLFIIGGLGFPIAFNLLRSLRQIARAKWYWKIHGKKIEYTPWMLNLNSRIVLVTSLILTVAGTLLFFIFEYHNTLAGHTFFGKVVTSFFSATAPRTAGFNTVDLTALSFPTIMIFFLLMWIGASPGSTGGGIKTSTIAIATLNFISLARGKTKIEVGRREIADVSVRRAFAIISLSLVAIGLGTFGIAYTDGHQDLMLVAWECFAAYTTAGMSLGLTGELSPAGRIVIMLLMFSGRVGLLTLLIAVFKAVKNKPYHYPSEEILIN